MKINKTMILAISVFAGVFGSVIFAYSWNPTDKLQKAHDFNNKKGRALQPAEIQEIIDDLNYLYDNAGGLTCTTRQESLHYDIKHGQAVQLGFAFCDGGYKMVGGGCAPDRDEDTYTEVDYNIPYGSNG